MRLLERPRDRAGQGDFQTVQNPGDAEREHDQPVKPQPWKLVESRGNVGVDDDFGLGCHWGTTSPASEWKPSATSATFAAHMKDSGLAIAAYLLRP